jgi:hypothetical protein
MRIQHRGGGASGGVTIKSQGHVMLCGTVMITHFTNTNNTILLAFIYLSLETREGFLLIS